MNNKSLFAEPQAVVVRFDVMDVIATSGGVSTTYFEGSSINSAVEAE